MDFPFYKIVPGGNATIILTSETCRENLPSYSAKLMDPMHIQAEQVGLLRFASAGDALPHLQMMGGEFCINATRAATLIVAQKGLLTGLGEDALHGYMEVSGATAPLHIVASLSREGLLTAAASVLTDKLPGETVRANMECAVTSKMYCAARMSCTMQEISCREVQDGVFLVQMPGIVHLLLDQQIHPYHEDWSKSAKKWRQVAEISEEPASGVVWYEYKDGAYSILPAVYVAATGSEHLETACGSASFAMAFAHGSRLDKLSENHSGGSAHSGVELVRVLQKSGEYLDVLIQIEENKVDAYVGGVVHLVAEGTAYI